MASSSNKIRFPSIRSTITQRTVGKPQKWKEGAKSQDKGEDPDFWSILDRVSVYTRSGILLKFQIGSDPKTKEHAGKILTTIECLYPIGYTDILDRV
ncbi:unnamed protein product [Cuscuta epithymum]|uniref:Uncharacterized protein n=1 Tax=Cuscuta epithymum TaxID=186058 RepID=A0AAV0F5X5_9ASTE|nr:unnamed protein product [Cuscuta epithymum]